MNKTVCQWCGCVTENGNHADLSRCLNALLYKVSVISSALADECQKNAMLTARCTNLEQELIDERVLLAEMIEADEAKALAE
jgi:hypothetical protein